MELNTKNQLVRTHARSGRWVDVNGQKAFVFEQGQGAPVVCLHGVPASSFLYRKIIPSLAENGYRGIAPDLLGMGLSAKPKEADYSWTSLGHWCGQLLDSMGLDKYHLVIHDIGGPIGCELIANAPERVLSVTILNSPIANLSVFKKPFPMFFFEQPLIGEVFLQTTVPFLFRFLMHLRGVQDNSVFGLPEARAYDFFLKAGDSGAAFLKIMRSFEANADKEKLYLDALRALNVPKQLIWGVHDKGLTLEKYGMPLQRALRLEEIHEVPGSHFIQEDCAPAIAHQLLALIAES
ncbi:MAG: alpha/beta fold hydrolase [Saprospiraceae bacterium]|nr:alpha/beta fold hydrolase [Saprospiraceae bacterium]